MGRSEEPRFFAAGLTVVLAPWAWPQVRGWLRGAELIPLLPRAPQGHKETHVQTPGRAVPADLAEVGTCGDGGPWFVSHCLLKWLCSPLPRGEDRGVTQTGGGDGSALGGSAGRGAAVGCWLRDQQQTAQVLLNS